MFMSASAHRWQGCCRRATLLARAPCEALERVRAACRGIDSTSGGAESRDARPRVAAGRHLRPAVHRQTLTPGRQEAGHGATTRASPERSDASGAPFNRRRAMPGWGKALGPRGGWARGESGGSTASAQREPHAFVGSERQPRTRVKASGARDRAAARVLPAGNTSRQHPAQHRVNPKTPQLSGLLVLVRFSECAQVARVLPQGNTACQSTV